MSTVYEVSAAFKVTHYAKKALACYRCGTTIQPGETFRRFRERALTSHESLHEGAYPTRNECSCCVAKRNGAA